MGTKPRRFASLLLALLLPATAGIAAPTPTAPTPQRNDRFDAIFAKVIGPGSMDMDLDAYEAYLQQLRTLLPPGDPAREVQFRSVYCGSSRWQDPKQGMAYAQEAVRLARVTGDLASQARAQYCRIDYTATLHGEKAALKEADQMVALLLNTKEPQLLAEALVRRGSLLSHLGDQAKALLDFQRARAGFREAGIHHDVDALQWQIAVAYRRIGNFSQAAHYFIESTRQQQRKQDWGRLADSLVQLGWLYSESGTPEKSRTAFQRALAIASRHNDRLNEINANTGMAAAQIALGLFDAALSSLRQARSHADAVQFDRNEDLLLLLTGQALAGKGQHKNALTRYAEALPLIEQDGNRRYLALLYQARAASEEALGQLDEALADYKRFSALQVELQEKMRLQQSRMLEYEYEIHRREFENHRLRTEAAARRQQLTSSQRVRHWQTIALVLGLILVNGLAVLAWRQHRRARELRMLAMTDPLTGIASRLATEASAHLALGQSLQSRQPLAVALLDIDHFKAINDRFGHAAGDQVLRAVTATWQEQLRGHDLLGRIGGEEFAIICNNTTPMQAVAVAQRLLDATRALRLPDIDPALRISTSIGLSTAQPGDSRESLFARADAALYRAKQQGRDRLES